MPDIGPSYSRALLGPGLLIVLAALLGVAAVCVRPDPPPVPVVVAPSTLVIVAPSEPTATVYVFDTATPLPDRLPAVTSTPVPAVLILATPEPTMTPVPMLVLPATPTNTPKPMVQRG